MNSTVSNPTVGHIDYDVSVRKAYLLLAEEDEKAAEALLQANLERQAAYHVVQAMEKYVRAKIYMTVDPRIESVRKANQSHSVGDAISYLLSLSSDDAAMNSRITGQLKEHFTKSTRFDLLHNDLRYPYYSRKNDGFLMTVVSRDFVKDLLVRLQWLKSFLNGLNLLPS